MGRKHVGTPINVHLPDRWLWAIEQVCERRSEARAVVIREIMEPGMTRLLAELGHDGHDGDAPIGR